MCKTPDIHPLSSGSTETAIRANDISTDLTWIDMLKGIAIVGVVLENWINYMKSAPAPALAYSLVRVLASLGGICVQVFFILSGFGLTTSYLKQLKANWSWRKWAWRRITKIVVPYEIVIVLTFLLSMLGSYVYETIQVQFCWSSLLAYLTFTRSLYPPSWAWNPSFWFMPIIIGLYVCFPVLIWILRKWGPLVLLLMSVVVTYGTLTIAVLTGFTGQHDSALFTFWLFAFVLGILLAYEKETNPPKLRVLVGPGAFVLGLVFLMCAWALRAYVPLGRAFNDSVTSIGISLVLLNLSWAARAQVPAVGTALNALSGQSYLMYLVHYPIMMFLIGPPLRVPMNPILVVILGGLYTLAIFFLCRFISKPMNRLTSRLYSYRSLH